MINEARWSAWEVWQNLAERENKLIDLNKLNLEIYPSKIVLEYT